MTLFKSLPWRRIAYVVCTALLAFACGHLVQMQVGSTPKVAALADAPPEAQPMADLQLNTPSCHRTATVEPGGIAGMFRIHAQAPCTPEGRIAVAHGPLAADWSLDADGEAFLSFTPLTSGHPVLVTWPDGTTTRHPVADAPHVTQHRVALAWDGPQFFALNVEEFGARDPINTHAPISASFSPGGFLSTLGDGTGRMAEVYTLPETTAAHGVVRLTVSAPISLRTCGRQARAEAFQADPFGGLMISQVDVAIPECQAVGQTLTLRNLFRDLRLAAR